MVSAVWTDYVSGSLTNALPAITAGSTQTMTSEGLTTLATVVDGVTRAKITVDPFAVNGLPEFMYVKSHTAGSNTAIVQRVAGQPLRTHNASETWVHGPLAEDFTEFQAQLDNQFHTSVFTAAGQVLGASAANTPATTNLGNEYETLTVATAQTSKWLARKSSCFQCTSGTRPSSPFEGMLIYETDTDRIYVYNSSAWKFVWHASEQRNIAHASPSHLSAGGSYSPFLSVSFTPPVWASGVYISVDVFNADAGGPTNVGFKLFAGSVVGIENRVSPQAANRIWFSQSDKLTGISTAVPVTMGLQAKKFSGTGTIGVGSSGDGDSFDTTAIFTVEYIA